MKNVKHSPFLIRLINLLLLVSMCVAAMTTGHPTLHANQSSTTISVEYPLGDDRAVPVIIDSAIELYNAQTITNAMWSGIIIGDRSPTLPFCPA